MNLYFTDIASFIQSENQRIFGPILRQATTTGASVFSTCNITHALKYIQQRSRFLCPREQLGKKNQISELFKREKKGGKRKDGNQTAAYISF